TSDDDATIICKHAIAAAGDGPWVSIGAKGSDGDEIILFLDWLDEDNHHKVVVKLSSLVGLHRYDVYKRTNGSDTFLYTFGSTPEPAPGSAELNNLQVCLYDDYINVNGNWIPTMPH